LPAGHRAVSVLYQAFLTGLVLTLVTRRGEDQAAEFVFRLFRRQHLEKFQPGLAKLGLDRLPHAVACAQYHYLSNQLGGVKTEYARESDRKAWVRYPPPRWIWYGASICGIPSRVNAAMLHGWHGHNGVTLGNPRLGFVCAGQTVDGHPGLEGYYLEHERDLAPDERVRFAPGETMPAFDPATAPRLDPVDWPPERLEAVVARYSMEYVRTTLPVALELLGPVDTRALLGHAARLIGMQLQRRDRAAPRDRGARPRALRPLPGRARPRAGRDGRGRGRERPRLRAAAGLASRARPRAARSCRLRGVVRAVAGRPRGPRSAAPSRGRARARQRRRLPRRAGAGRTVIQP